MSTDPITPADPPGELPTLLTVDQTARQLSISRARLYQLLDSGAIHSVHVGRLRRIAVEDLRTYIDGLRKQNTA